MASLCLPNSRLFVGLDFADHADLAGELADPARPAALLFPTDAADLAGAPPPGPISLVLLDGTWSQAKKLLQLNPRIAALPRYSLAPPPSEYVIRREPSREYVSTLEALAHALAVLEGDASCREALLAPFRRMVAMQLEHRERLNGGLTRHRKRWAGSENKPSGVPAELLTRFNSLVCVVGEANAWNARLPGAHPDELVHWLACRVSTGELFEAVLAPRNPLAPSTPVHTRLAPEILAAGDDLQRFVARWSRFLREGDLLCSWGGYPLELAEKAGALSACERIDLRKVVGDVARVSPGSTAEVVTRWGLGSSPLGTGRGGERLGELVALARHLATRPRDKAGDGAG
jgi:hypothetical protein